MVFSSTVPVRRKTLSVNVGGRAEVHAGTLENAVIQGGTVILLSPTSADENFVVEEDRAPVELTGVLHYWTALQ